MNNSNNHYKGAGILPYSFNKKGQLVFLLGMENYIPLNNKSLKFSDFGGGRKDNEYPIDTALREFDEESVGAIEDKDIIKINLLSSYKVIRGNYYQFVIKIEYCDKIVKTYNRIRKKLSSCMKMNVVNSNNKLDIKHSITSCPDGFLEKKEFRWFTVSEILKNEDLFRDDFYKTFLMIVEKSHKI